MNANVDDKVGTNYLVELLLGEPDIVLGLLGGTRLVAELVPRLRKNLPTWHHFYLTSLLPLTHPCLLQIVCQQTNKQRNDHFKHSLSLSLGWKSGHFSLLSKKARLMPSATLRPRQNTQDLLPCRRRRSNCLCTPLSAQDSEKDLRRAHAPWRAGAIHRNVVCAIDGIVIICVTNLWKAKARSMASPSSFVSPTFQKQKCHGWHRHHLSHQYFKAKVSSPICYQIMLLLVSASKNWCPSPSQDFIVYDVLDMQLKKSVTKKPWNLICMHWPLTHHCIVRAAAAASGARAYLCPHCIGRVQARACLVKLSIGFFLVIR